MSEIIDKEFIPYEVTEINGVNHSTTICPYLDNKLVGSFGCVSLCSYSEKYTAGDKVVCRYKFKNRSHE